MKKKYKEYSQADFAKVNKDMLALWEKEGLFEATMELRKGTPRYVFYDGPPLQMAFLVYIT